MGEFRVLEIKQSVFADNDRRADEVRCELKEKKVFLLNLMSSSGSGKTTTLTRTIEHLKEEFRIGVMEADIDPDVDAQTISSLGVKAIQLHTGGMCRLDADMTAQGLAEIITEEMADVALKMKVRAHYTFDEMCKLTHAQSDSEKEKLSKNFYFFAPFQSPFAGLSMRPPCASKREP